jgi:hypothetical protein
MAISAVVKATPARNILNGNKMDKSSNSIKA